jgi:hypothetical protein
MFCSDFPEILQYNSQLQYYGVEKVRYRNRLGVYTEEPVQLGTYSLLVLLRGSKQSSIFLIILQDFLTDLSQIKYNRISLNIIKIKTVNHSQHTDLRLIRPAPPAQRRPPPTAKSIAFAKMLCRPHPLSDAQICSILQQALDLVDSTKDLFTDDEAEDR